MNKTTYAKIWLPNDEKSIKVQQINIENMERNIGIISENLGAKVERTSFAMPGLEGRFVLISPPEINRHYNPHISSFYGRSQRYTSATYMRYRHEHPIVKKLLDSCYNNRVSYYRLWEFLNENRDFDWSILAPYYEAINFSDFNIEKIEDAQESIAGNIEETAQGYSPIGGSPFIYEARKAMALRGEWKPSYHEIQQEAETNELVLKRVFRKDI